MRMRIFYDLKIDISRRKNVVFFQFEKFETNCEYCVFAFVQFVVRMKNKFVSVQLNENKLVYTRI